MYRNLRPNPSYKKAFERYVRYGDPITEPPFIEIKNSKPDDSMEKLSLEITEELNYLKQVLKHNYYAHPKVVFLIKFQNIVERILALENDLECKHNFNPNQPRVPRGVPEGGQWTKIGAEGSYSSSSKKPKKVGSNNSNNTAKKPLSDDSSKPTSLNPVDIISNRFPRDDNYFIPTALTQSVGSNNPPKVNNTTEENKPKDPKPDKVDNNKTPSTPPAGGKSPPKKIDTRDPQTTIETLLKELRSGALPHPPKKGEGKCAEFFRKALQRTGFPRQWGDAVEYFKTLKKLGFKAIPLNTKQKQEYIKGNEQLVLKGDVVVMNSPANRAKNNGHIQMFDGKNWISDHIQASKAQLAERTPKITEPLWPGQDYRDYRPYFTVFRYPGYDPKR